MTTQEVSLSTLIAEGSTQARQYDKALAERYGEAMKDGAVFPPVVGFKDKNGIYLGDGFHRLGGAKVAKRTKILCDIRVPIEGESAQRSAILYAVGANEEHGQNRSNADKRHAVEILLRDPEWSKWTDREIARQCRVTHPFVGTQRTRLINAGVTKKTTTRKRKDKHGNTSEINTSKIGKAKASKAKKVSVTKSSTADDMNLSDLRTAVDLLSKFPHSPAEAARRYRNQLDLGLVESAIQFLEQLVNSKAEAA